MKTHVKKRTQIHPLCDPESGECGGYDRWTYEMMGLCPCKTCHGRKLTVKMASKLIVGKYHGRLSGSRARGDAKPDSDWDFYMPYRYVKAFAKFLKSEGVSFYSPITGAVTFKSSEGVQMEVSMMFPTRQPVNQVAAKC